MKEKVKQLEDKICQLAKEEFDWKINKIIKNFYRYLIVEILKE